MFLELKRDYDEIYYWYDQDMEVDFLIKQDDSVKELIQVSYDVSSAGEREETSLLHGLKEFDLQKGFVITGDTRKEIEIDGKKVKYVPLWFKLLRIS